MESGAVGAEAEPEDKDNDAGDEEEGEEDGAKEHDDPACEALTDTVGVEACAGCSAAMVLVEMEMGLESTCGGGRGGRRHGCGSFNLKWGREQY